MKSFAAIIVIILVIAAPGCGIPSSGIDEDLKAEGSYRQSSDRCANLDLSQASMSPAMMRGLMGCLNSNEQLTETNALIQSSSDEELAPIAEAVNRLILSRPDRLSALDQSFQQLDADGTLALSLESLGRAAGHPELAPAVMRLAGQFYFGGESGILSYVLSRFSPVPNERLLAALAVLGGELNASHVSDGLDALIALTEVRASQSLQRRFRRGSPHGDGELPSAQAVAEGAVATLRAGASAERGDLGKQLLELIVSGEAFAFTDHVVPDGSLEWANATPLWGQLVTELFARDARFLRLSPSFFAALSRTETAPVRCMGGTTPLVALPPARVFQELGALSLHEFLSTVALARPFCDFPPEILAGAQTLNPLSVTPAAGVMEDWVRFTNGRPALTQFLIDVLARDGDRLANLEPAVRALSLRTGAPTDLMLFLTAYELRDRPLFQERVRSFLRPRESLDGRSLYDEAAAALQHMGAAELAQVITALEPFINDDAQVMGPMLAGLRASFHANDVHPWVDLVKDVLGEAPRNRELFTALFKITARNQVQFVRVVREFSAMCARDDGRMRGVLTSLFALFRPTAERSRVVVNRTELPAQRNHLRHNLIAEDLNPAISLPRRPDAYRACRDLDLSFSLADYADERFTAVFSDFRDCLAAQQSDEDLVRGLNLLVDTGATAGTALEGRSVFAWSVDTIKAFGRSLVATAEAVRRALTAVRDGRMTALTQGFTHWTEAATDLVSPLTRILSLAETHAGAPTAVTRNWNELQARVCETTKEYEDDVGATRCKEMPVLAAIRAQLAVWEPGADVETRTAAIIDEFETAVVHDSREALPLPQRWEKTAFTEAAQNFYDYLVNARRGDDPNGENEHKVTEALVHFLGSFNSRMNAYAPSAHEDLAMADEVAAWMVNQANQLSVVPYYYEGDLTPRVRLVSNLDRLGLTMVNTDIVTRTGAMPGVLGLSMLRLAWADEPLEERPLFGRDEVTSFTLEHTIEMLLGGLPPESACSGVHQVLCKTKMRNLKGFVLPDQVEDEYPLRLVPSLLTVLQESLTTEDRQCGRRPSDCVGLKVVRNLFASLWEKTPESLRPIFDSHHVFVGAHHNVNAAVALSRLGVFRKATLALWGKSGSDVDLRHFMRAAAILGRHPDRDLVERLLKKTLAAADQGGWSEPGRRLIPRAVSTIFDVIQGPRGALLGDTLYYAVGAFSSAHLAMAPTDVVGMLARMATGLVDERGGRASFVDHVGAASQLLASPFFAALVETFHRESLTETGAWPLFRGRYAALRASAGYPREDLDRLLEDVVSFIENPPAADTPAGVLYAHTLDILLGQLERGETEAVLRALARNPHHVQDLARALGRMGREGSAQRFLDAVGRLMVEPQ